MRRILLLYLLCYSSLGYTQKPETTTAFWKLTSINGEVILNGAYWNQDIERLNTLEEIENAYGSVGLFVNTRSFFWHPNFVTLDLNVGYSPETGQRLSLLAPDRNEINTLKKLYAKATFFKHNNLSFNFFTNINETYNNRENLTNFKSNYKNFGGTLNYSNKTLPFTVSYNNSIGDQKELETNVRFVTKQDLFEIRTHKSFGDQDWNEFVYSYNKYEYDNTFELPNSTLIINNIKNNIGIWQLTNRLFLDSDRKYSLTSRISNENQTGDYFFKRFQIMENAFLKLPKNFTFSGNYNYFNIEGSSQHTKQHNVKGILLHKLYESLRTNISYNYNNIVSDNQYNENTNRLGLDVRYTKKIPLDGVLSLSYKLNLFNQNRRSEDNIVNVQNESHLLSDGEMVLLNNQNIDASSITVRDNTGTIIYQLNIDYVIIEYNEFIEIQRIPGGIISNNSFIYVDYMYVQPQSFKFTSITNLFGINISLFKNKFEVYYTTSKQDYVNPVNINYLTLNYFTKNVYGTRFRYKFINVGVEYDDYNSTIVPYRLMKYYISLNGNIKNKFTYALNGIIQDYYMILEEGNKQKFFNITGNMSYKISNKTRIRIEGGYRNQEGTVEGINLKLLTSKLEISTQYRALYINAGLAIYRNELFNETTDFNRVNLSITRRF
ncbi:MAG: hypothetical protein L3J09_06475 [Flavobacteriaceae bacterium]|nr:hypothetical protein [Flavobacteriaceae bacterium]